MIEFECVLCASEIELPDTVPSDERTAYLEDHGWRVHGPEANDEWICPDCVEDRSESLENEGD